MTISEIPPARLEEAQEFDRQQFANILMEEALLSRGELDRAERASSQTGQRLDVVLLELGLLEDEAMASALANLAALPRYQVGADASERIDALASQPNFMRQMSVAPLSVSNDVVRIAVSDPFDRIAAESIGFRLDLPVEKLVATKNEIDALIEEHYGDALAKPEGLVGAAQVADDDIERLKSIASEGPVVKFVADTIAAAVEAVASDVHLESFENNLEIRFRVDGRLKRHGKAPSELRSAVISRIKIMAGLNISERRRPQDGRARLAVRGRNIDLRISTAPTQFGESVVIRLLDRSKLRLDWESLGFSEAEASVIERLTSAPHGMFLVTGPTGSGKTTTLYTALSKLNSDDRKIVTVEDPIEYTLAGVNQIQVHPEIDLTFGSALRAILRQDPDVVMVGEIRDAETAENAVRAALMGRMVLSTVHTNSALGAIDRLVDLGVPPFLLGATLRGVMSQRLLRRLCTNCKAPFDAERAERYAAKFRLSNSQQLSFADPVGCDACSSGYAGRSVVAEIIEITPELSQAIEKGASAGELKILVQQCQSLSEVGLHKAASGEVSVQDVLGLLGGFASDPEGEVT